MKLRKLLAILLILVLALGLIACGPDKKKTDDGFSGKTLKFAGLDGGYGTAGWEAVIEGFEALTGATVEATFEKNIAEVIRPQISAGTPPDVIYMSIGGEGALTETMIKEEIIMDLTDVLEMKIPGEDVTVASKIIPGFTDTNNTNPYGDGKTYLAPLFFTPTGLWYNRAMFSEDGGKYNLPTNFEEFFELGEQAKQDGISLFTYPTAGYFDTFSFGLFHEIGGTELFDKLMNYDVDAWTNEVDSYFENIGKLKDYLEPNTVSQANLEGFTKNQLAVMENKALFMPNGSWIVSEMEDALASESVAEDFKWGFMALPAMEAEGDRYATSFFEQCFIPTDTEEPELAKEFIAYLYSDEAVKTFAEHGQIQPVTDVDQFFTDEDMKHVYGIYNEDVKVAMGGFAAPPSVEGVSVSEALFDAVDSVMSGQITVDEWKDGVVTAVTAFSEAKE